MQSTIALFKRMYDNLPPLFPDTDKRDMKIALEHLLTDAPLSVEDVEDVMIDFGYRVWPWNRAFGDVLLVNEQQMNDHFFLPKLSEEVRTKYQEFLSCGGSMEEVKTGRAALYFTSDEQSELNGVLNEAVRDLRDYTVRQVMSTDKKQYLHRVEEYKTTLRDIVNKLEDMKNLATKEDDHPGLADEIRARVRSFEYGLCWLGPEPKYDDVSESLDFFVGRKIDLNRLKGIHTTVAFSWEE